MYSYFKGREMFKHFTEKEIFSPELCPVNTWDEIDQYKLRHPDLKDLPLKDNLTYTLNELDIIREDFGKYIHDNEFKGFQITSTWRPDQANRKSNHVICKAVDFVILHKTSHIYDLFIRFIKPRLRNYRIIWEYDNQTGKEWIHLDTQKDKYKLLVGYRKNSIFTYEIYKKSPRLM